MCLSTYLFFYLSINLSISKSNFVYTFKKFLWNHIEQFNTVISLENIAGNILGKYGTEFTSPFRLDTVALQFFFSNNVFFEYKIILKIHLHNGCLHNLKNRERKLVITLVQKKSYCWSFTRMCRWTTII